jgi:flagellar protein FlaG
MPIELINGPGNNMPTPVRAEFLAAGKPGHSSRGGPEVEKGPDLSELSNLVANVQKNLDAMHGKNLNFLVHAASGRTMITVSDQTTGQVIREIPSREMLNLAVKLEEMMGLIFDQKA